jgi:tRNA modification GTPase
MTAEKMLRETRECSVEIDKLLEGHRLGKFMQNGVKVAIVGSPNVGKSTLMNLLSGWDRSIVTKIPGTTRDIVEETIQIDGVSLKLLDTAGIRDTDDEVETIGINRAKKAMTDADAVILVIDGSRLQQAQDRLLLESVKRMPHVVALNKTDLPPAVFPQDLEDCVEISAARGEGGEALRRELKRILSLDSVQDICTIASQRQYDCLVRAHEALIEVMQALKDEVTLDAVGVLLEEVVDPLAELTGQRVRDAVLDRVFSHFCVGK